MWVYVSYSCIFLYGWEKLRKYPRGGNSLRDHLMHAYLSQMDKLR